MLVPLVTMADIGRKIENAAQLTEAFFGKHFGMFNTQRTYYNG